MKYILFTLLLLAAIPHPASACTRVVYHGPNDTVLTGRTMDFTIEIPANLWIFPRGMERNGEVGPNSYTWTSRFGSVIASSWDIATADGMNEKGLVANLLWLVESEYPDFDPEAGKPGMAISLWAQYALDQFATVAEAVEGLREAPFIVVTDFIPNTEKLSTLHLSLSDASGDSAIFEYINGELVIHHDRTHRVMTNSPVFSEQLAILRYWQEVPPNAFLPGTVRAADRFVRANHFIQAVTQTDDPVVSVAAVFSVIRTVSVPYGISMEGHPNLSTTRWRAVADQKNLRYFFETVLTPNTFWVELNEIDFAPEAGVRYLPIMGGEIRAGNVTGEFVENTPFRFYGPQAPATPEAP